MGDVIQPRQVAENLKELWSPGIIAEVDNSFVQVAKIKGEFPWHSHEMEDELFMVLEGEMSIELEDSRVKLKTGDLHVVPKGTAHRPSAAEECLILLFENPPGTRVTSCRKIHAVWNNNACRNEPSWGICPACS